MSLRLFEYNIEMSSKIKTEFNEIPHPMLDINDLKSYNQQRLSDMFSKRGNNLLDKKFVYLFRKNGKIFSISESKVVLDSEENQICETVCWDDKEDSWKKEFPREISNDKKGLFVQENTLYYIMVSEVQIEYDRIIQYSEDEELLSQRSLKIEGDLQMAWPPYNELGGWDIVVTSYINVANQLSLLYSQACDDYLENKIKLERDNERYGVKAHMEYAMMVKSLADSNKNVKKYILYKELNSYLEDNVYVLDKLKSKKEIYVDSLGYWLNLSEYNLTIEDYFQTDSDNINYIFRHLKSTLSELEQTVSGQKLYTSLIKSEVCWISKFFEQDEENPTFGNKLALQTVKSICGASDKASNILSESLTELLSQYEVHKYQLDLKKKKLNVDVSDLDAKLSELNDAKELWKDRISKVRTEIKENVKNLKKQKNQLNTVSEDFKKLKRNHEKLKYSNNKYFEKLREYERIKKNKGYKIKVKRINDQIFTINKKLKKLGLDKHINNKIAVLNKDGICFVYYEVESLDTKFESRLKEIRSSGSDSSFRRINPSDEINLKYSDIGIKNKLELENVTDITKDIEAKISVQETMMSNYLERLEKNCKMAELSVFEGAVKENDLLRNLNKLNDKYFDKVAELEELKVKLIPDCEEELKKIVAQADTAAHYHSLVEELKGPANVIVLMINLFNGINVINKASELKYEDDPGKIALVSIEALGALCDVVNSMEFLLQADEVLQTSLKKVLIYADIISNICIIILNGKSMYDNVMENDYGEALGDLFIIVGSAISIVGALGSLGVIASATAIAGPLALIGIVVALFGHLIKYVFRERPMEEWALASPWGLKTFNNESEKHINNPEIRHKLDHSLSTKGILLERKDMIGKYINLSASEIAEAKLYLYDLITKYKTEQYTSMSNIEYWATNAYNRNDYFFESFTLVFYPGMFDPDKSRFIADIEIKLFDKYVLYSKKEQVIDKNNSNFSYKDGKVERVTYNVTLQDIIEYKNYIRLDKNPTKKLLYQFSRPNSSVGAIAELESAIYKYISAENDLDFNKYRDYTLECKSQLDYYGNLDIDTFFGQKQADSPFMYLFPLSGVQSNSEDNKLKAI